jgi:hypothetical protein
MRIPGSGGGNGCIQRSADHVTSKALLDLALRLADPRTLGDRPDRAVKAVEKSVGRVNAVPGDIEPDLAQVGPGQFRAGDASSSG